MVGARTSEEAPFTVLMENGDIQIRQYEDLLIAEKTNALMTCLEQNHYQMLSKPRSAAYDPPWTIPSLRRNEVHIDVE